MKTGTKATLQIMGFLAGFAVIWIILTVIFQPKYFFTSEYCSPETELLQEFYRQPRNSLDILYVGSSHVYNAVNPTLISEKTGLTGFNMACSNQDMFSSYIYIKEALRFQTPRYIVLDSYYLQYGIYTSDNFKRAFDDMKWSRVKLEALKGYFAHSEGEKKSYRFLTLLDFHGRWEELGKEDFGFEVPVSEMGFIPSDAVGACEREKYYEDSQMTVPEETEAYFNRILELCRENGIQLVLVSLPSSLWTRGYCKSAEAFAEQRNIPYIELNSDEALEAMNIDSNTDFRNLDHLNTSGASKLSEYLARCLMELKP